MRDGERRVTVTHHFETTVDTEQLQEWLRANFSVGNVQVMDADTGEVLHDGF